MLIIEKTGEKLWSKYTADTIRVGGQYYSIDPWLSESQIDNWVWNQLSDEAKKTLTQKLDKK